MKKNLLLLFAISFLRVETNAQTTQSGPASCPIIIKNELTCIGPNQYKYFIKWDNPTSGNKSIKVTIGSCFNTCINASVDGQQTFYFSCTTLPTVVYYAHTGNSTCLGTACGSSLPLVLTDFSARKKADKVLIQWTLEKSSLEAGLFVDVERAIDARTFTLVDRRFVSLDTTTYTFEDPLIGSKNVFYRLKTDRGYSSVLMVRSDVSKKLSVLALGSKTVQVNNGQQGTLRIATVDGRLVRSVRILNEIQTVPIDLRPGTYIATIISNRGETKSVLFVQ